MQFTRDYKNKSFQEIFLNLYEMNKLAKEYNIPMKIGTISESENGKIKELMNNYTSRKEAHQFINKNLKKNKINELEKNLEIQFPKNIWENHFPTTKLIQYLFNNYAEDFEIND